MINFDEELKRFKPHEEIEEAEEVIYKRDLTDLTDAMRELIDKDGKAYRR
jgi:hypothetical protein